LTRSRKERCIGSSAATFFILLVFQSGSAHPTQLARIAAPKVATEGHSSHLTREGSAERLSILLRFVIHLCVLPCDLSDTLFLFFTTETDEMFGKGGAIRHRKILKDNLQGISLSVSLLSNEALSSFKAPIS